MNLANWLDRAASAWPDRPALFEGTEQVADYAGFGDRAARLGAGLAARGVKAGDRVAIVAPNTPDYLVALFGIWFAGAVAVPINAKLHAQETAWILENAGACLALCSAEAAAALADHAGRCERVAFGSREWCDLAQPPPAAGPAARLPSDLAWLFYTSGTTGRPKGVMITHGMLTAMSLSYLADVDQPQASDATIYAAPMSHGAGLYSLVHVLVGARHVVPPSGGFAPDEVLDLAEAHGAAHLFAAPTMVRRLTDAARRGRRRGAGLRTVVYAGGPMYNADIIEAVDLFGPVFVQIYGQGECPMAITALSRHDVADRSHPRWKERLGSVGRAQSAVEVAIGDGNGRFLAPGETGEIMVRGLPVMPGYWKNPQATAATLRDGWLMTGDIGCLDTDGYLTLVDRSKDVIISGGSNIYPREVEEVLLAHPGVAQASVVGRPHPEWGEEVVAFVVPVEGAQATPETLDRHCLERIARFKRPRAYLFVSDLPKNNYGKVLKTELRQRLQPG